MPSRLSPCFAFPLACSLALSALGCGSEATGPVSLSAAQEKLPGGGTLYADAAMSWFDSGSGGSGDGGVPADIFGSDLEAQPDAPPVDTPIVPDVPVTPDVPIGPADSGVCVPQCAGKLCGPDGCGAFCGFCPNGFSCTLAGACAPGKCVLDAPQCSGSTLQQCDGPSVVSMDCALSGKVCGLDAKTGQSACVASCTPQCAGKACGNDGCGGACGLCPTGASCNILGQCDGACVPQCQGKACGPNGCGGDCGLCATNEDCLPSGLCAPKCVPQCGVKQCGPNGCGGACGLCPTGTSCNGAGQCEATCTPGCNGTTCGPDGCGGSCTCAQGLNCAGGTCVKPGCKPQCGDAQCGPDGCGGSCGSCSAAESCVGSACQPKPSACSGIPAAGACDGQKLKRCVLGVLVVEQCPSWQKCAWNPYSDNNNGAYGCVPKTWKTGECGLIGANGACDGNDVLVCTQSGLSDKGCKDNQVCGWGQSPSCPTLSSACWTCLNAGGGSGGGGCLGIPASGTCQFDTLVTCSSGTTTVTYCPSLGKSCACNPLTGCACQ